MAFVRSALAMDPAARVSSREAVCHPLFEGLFEDYASRHPHLQQRGDDLGGGVGGSANGGLQNGSSGNGGGVGGGAAVVGAGGDGHNRFAKISSPITSAFNCPSSCSSPESL